MKTKRFIMISSSMVTILLLLNACGQSPSALPTQGPPEVTLTFSGDTCTYSGSMSLPAKFNMNVVVDSQAKTVYGFVLVTLEKGKTVEDLQAWPTFDPPRWLKHQLTDTGPAFKPGTVKRNIDLGAYTFYAGDPIYIACFADDPATRKIGALGPIEITK